MVNSFQNQVIRNIDISSLVLSHDPLLWGSWLPCLSDTLATNGPISDHLGSRFSAPVKPSDDISAGQHLNCSLVRDTEAELPR